MFCPSCGVAAQPGQRFCTSCGAAITGVPLTDTRELPTVAMPAPGGALPPPSFPPPSAPSPTPDAALDPTVFDFEQFDTTGTLAVVPARTEPVLQLGPDTAEVSMVEDTQPFGLTPLLIVAVLTGAVVVLAGVLDQVSYRVTGDVNDSFALTMNELSSNSLVACIIAAVLLVIGASVGATGRRVGVGLAGGVGVAVAGFMAWTAAQGVAVLDTLKAGLAEGGTTYRLTTTLEVGFWLTVAAAVLGAVVAAVSVAGAFGARVRIHPAVGALGVLGTIAVVVGPLLPMHGAELVDNFSSSHSVGPVQHWKSVFLVTLDVNHPAQPPITTYMRLLLLLLLLVGGLVGFLSGTRWGIGVVLGSFSMAAWLWATSALEVGDLPFGIAGGNPGADSFTPHVVTTVGVVVVLVAALAGLALALSRRT